MFGIAAFIVLLVMQFCVFSILAHGTFDKSALAASRIIHGIMLVCLITISFYINRFVIAMLA